MIKAVAYFYWKLYKTNLVDIPPVVRKYITYFQITFFLLMYIIMIALVISVFIYDYNFVLENNWLKPFDKEYYYLKISLVILPFYIFVVLLYKYNREKVQHYISIFENSYSREMRKLNFYYWSFLFITISLMLYIPTILY